ncbi:MAG: response regulator [Bacteroidetes bacterium]|nr:MAG: response regulator [Bacteroidota bacterium]
MRNHFLAILFTFLSVGLWGNPDQPDSLQRVLNNLTGSEKVAALNQLALSLASSEGKRAMDLAEEALRLSETLHDARQKAKTLHTIGQIYQKKYDYTNAMKSFVEALRIWNDLGDEAGMAASKNQIGTVFFLQENYTQAEENLTEALEIWNKLQQPAGAAQCHKSLGDVYLAREIYGKALEHYRQALDLNLQVENIEEAAKIANHIGTVSSNLGDYDGALVYFNMCRDLHSSLEDLPKIAEDANHIALTLIARGAYEEALEENQMALELRQQLNDPYGIAESYKNLGVIYTRLGNKTQAATYLQKAVEILKKLEPKPGTPELFRDISDAYADLGKYKEAYQNHLAFSESRSAVFNQEKAKALLDLTTKYESEFEAEKQKRTIELLEMENAVDKKVRYFLFAVLALIASLLLSMFLSYKRKQKDNQLLRAKNEEIEAKNAEIDKKNLELQKINDSLDVLNRKLVTEMAERESIEKSSFARDRFLATMSHEMRTPINIIIGLTHLLLEENPREDQIEHLRTLQFSANNLVVFINDVLDFSKIEAGKLDLESREFAPRKLMDEVQTRFASQAQKQGVKMDFSMDKKIPEKLLGDPARLNQIISNLLTTSLKYTEGEGAIRVNLDIEELTRKQASLRLTIRDNGRKIEPEKIEQMFRSYSRTSNDIFEGYGSNDLTLAITKRLVDLQNGKISVNADHDEEGNRFTVILPFKIPAITATEKPAAKDKNTPRQRPDNFDHLAGNKILLVEDNKINQLVVAKMLRKLHMEVVTADDGLKALEALEKESFDLILMDIQMPNMDGYRATAEIRKHPDPNVREIPIIALTASAFLTEKEKAKLFGMNDHVGKPFAPEELLEKISNLLEIQKNA